MQFFWDSNLGSILKWLFILWCLQKAHRAQQSYWVRGGTADRGRIFQAGTSMFARLRAVTAHGPGAAMTLAGLEAHRSGGSDRSSDGFGCGEWKGQCIIRVQIWLYKQRPKQNTHMYTVGFKTCYPKCWNISSGEKIEKWHVQEGLSDLPLSRS